jgi:hypothetical protein
MNIGKTVSTMAGSSHPAIILTKLAFSLGVSIISKLVMEEITADKKSKKKCQFWF